MNIATMENKKKNRIGVLLGLVAYAGFIVTQSLNAPFAYGYGWPDSGVFMYMAKIICEGGTPYVDMFDHKGLVIYLINALGYLINSHWGIWLVEWIFLFASMYAAYCLINKFHCGVSAFVAVLISFAYMMPNYTMGNYTEEYAILFQVIALYFFVEYFEEKAMLSTKGTIAIGATFALVLLIRPNLVYGWIPFCAYIFLDNIVEKRFKEAINCIIYFVVGIAIVFVPAFLYLGLKGAIPQMLEDYLLYNLTYSGRNDNYALLSTISFFADNQIVKLTFLLGAIEVIYLIYKKNVQNKILLLYVINYIAFVLGFVIVVMPGNQYNHYAMCLIPHMLVIFSAVFDFLVKMIRENQGAIVAFLCFIYVGGQVIYPVWVDHINTTVYVSPTYEGYNADVISYVKQTTDIEDEILVTGEIDCWIYNFTNRKSASRYAYRPTPMTVEMQTEFWEGLRNNLPELIITLDPNVDVIQMFSSEYELEIQLGNRFLYRRK